MKKDNIVKSYDNVEDCTKYKKENVYKMYKVKLPTLFNLSSMKKTIGSNIKINNTLEYITSNHSGGAMFVSIDKGEIKNIYALVNEKFTNSWHKLIKPFDLKKYLINKDKYYYREKAGTLLDQKYWTKNGSLINMYNYNSFFDTYQFELLDFIINLVKNKKLINIDFIIWCKDVPLLPKNHIDIYINNFKYVTNNRSGYIPILSQSTCSNYVDIPIPNANEWAMVTGKYFPVSCAFDSIDKIKKVAFKDRIPKAFFRGSSTGCNRYNPRIELAKLSNKYPDLLDAGITEFVKRDKIDVDGTVYFTIPDQSLKKPKKPMNEQSEFKYILNVEGNGHAYRKSYLFFLGGVVLNVNSKFISWFDHLLVPYYHFIPIKEDLSNLIDIIKWCNKNESLCEKIAHNGLAFAKNTFNYDFMINHNYFRTSTQRSDPIITEFADAVESSIGGDLLSI